MLVVKPAPTNQVYIDPRLLGEVGDLAEEDYRPPTSLSSKAMMNSLSLNTPG